ncbi:MAG: hypothetical protein RMK84_19065 [Oscillochloridaceae bacterium]|nr:hypothetical protein [Chloroflexaceae bacterium]MDW8392227.1 hypothetical protein [Oscillochloridaceae bacterium]
MSDPAKTSGALPEHFAAPVLGVPFEFRSNSAEVIAATERAFGLWRSLPANLVETGPPGQVEVIVQAFAPDELAPGGTLVTRSHAGALIAAGRGRLLSALPAGGHALAFIAPEVAADEAWLRHEVLERLTLALAGARGRSPLRAGAVVWRGRGILFIGNEASLSATLAVGCAGAGAALLAAGVVFLSAGHAPALWGHPGIVRLPLEAARHFPDLPWRAVSAEPTLIELDAASLGADRLATHAVRAVLCLVEAVTGQASHLQGLARDEGLDRLARALEPDPSVIGPLAGLISERAYLLRAGADPRTAVALLEHLIERGELR